MSTIKNIMKTLPEILEGVKNYTFIDQEVEETAMKRLEICNPCESNSTPSKITITSTCTSCGCLLQLKSRGKNSKCPKDKWQ